MSNVLIKPSVASDYEFKDKEDYGLDIDDNLNNKSNLMEAISDFFGFTSHKSQFIVQLKELSKKYGLGKVSFDNVYDGDVSEKVFTIQFPENKNFDDLDYYWDKIISEMESFSKNNGLYNFFEESYIVLNC